MAGKAILTCRPNSHPFQDRTLTLEQPVKIGRSVARARSAPNNAIFDCKVLSRNHALFWYTNGKFFLQDTKSSNGTFVNNQRLSKSGEESTPREVCSGDIVQFGVDVLENALTHGCIVANLKLYLPDGKEAKASHSSSVMSSPGSLPVEDLYQLNQYIQEAIQREQMLENKLFTLQSVLDNIRQATDQGWKALIAEDRLLSRVEILENQLQTYSKVNFAEDKLREELRKLQEDKSQYQVTAKDFLKKVLEEKLDAVQKCQEVKRSLVNVEAEYSNLCEQMAKSHRDIQELAQKLSSQLAKNDEMEAKLQEIEDQHKETVERLEARNLELEQMLEKQHATEASLERQVSELEVAGHLAKKRASAYELQLKALNNIPITSGGDSYFEKSKEDLEVCNKEEEHDKLNHRLEEQMKNKEVFELFTAQLNLLQGEKRSRLQSGKLGEVWEGFSEERIDGEKELVEEEEEDDDDDEDEDEEEEARSNKLEPERDEEKSLSPADSVLQFEDMKGDEDKVTNNDNENIDPIKSQKEDHKYTNHDSKLILERSNELIVDVNQGKDILSKTCDSCLVGEKLQIQKGQQVIEEWQTQTLTEVNPLLNDPIKQQGVITNSSSFNDEETSRLKSQLIEAQQMAKQSRNEAAQMADRVKSLMVELESVNRSQDNKTKDELERKKSECSNLQVTISSLQSQIASLKEEFLRLQTDRDVQTPNIGSIEVNSNLSETSLQLKELQLKVQNLEEELVIVGTKYMNCNEERTKLNRELNNLRLDYQAVTHQPYFTLIFALPCIVLFMAIVTAFYPTLSHLTGTSDHTHPSE